MTVNPSGKPIRLAGIISMYSENAIAQPMSIVF